MDCPECPNRRNFLAKSGLVAVGGLAFGAFARPAEASRSTHIKPRFDSYCGIYCGACTLALNGQKATDAAEIKCLGCKSKKTADHCTKCDIKRCAKEKNVEVCSDCKEYPCDQLKAFHHNGSDYRLVAAHSLETIHEVGVQKWLTQQKTRWTCHKCKAHFGFQDKVCPRCGGKIFTCAEEAAKLKKDA